MNKKLYLCIHKYQFRMRKNYMLLLALLLMTGAATAKGGQKRFDVYGVGFYNVENLFDTCHDAGKNDFEFLPDGTYKWTAEKYASKLANMARVLAEMGTDKLPGVGCAVIGVAEVENARCLADLCSEEPLKHKGFRYVHEEGADQRGVDCALLYNPSLFSVRNTRLVPYKYKLAQDSLRATRGFFIVSGTMGGEHVTVVVNHLPSRGSTSYYREEGAAQLRAVRDSLIAADPKVKLIIMGDMNDDPQDKSMAVCLGGKRKISEVGDSDMYNPWWDVLESGTGTLTYRGAWNLFDQILLSPSLLDREGRKDYTTLKLFSHQIFRRDYLIQQDGPYKGSPLRTHGGGKWLNGYSDHLPTVVYLIKARR